jgi:hypothetical protein
MLTQRFFQRVHTNKNTHIQAVFLPASVALIFQASCLESLYEI